MIAVIETGGKQYIVEPDTIVRMGNIPGEAGADVTFDKVLLVADDKGAAAHVGAPYLEKASVAGKILRQGRARKVMVIKYKSKTRQMSRRGHRQHYTDVTIGAIKA